jgi:hypothetical protein
MDTADFVDGFIKENELSGQIRFGESLERKLDDDARAKNPGGPSRQKLMKMIRAKAAAESQQ